LDRHDLVPIRFVKDFHTSDGLLNFAQDSTYLVDRITADALVFSGIAVTTAGTRLRPGRGIVAGEPTTISAGRDFATQSQVEDD
jgi:hypothetical protein